MAGQEERRLHAGSDPGGKPSDWPGFLLLGPIQADGEEIAAWVER